MSNPQSDLHDLMAEFAAEERDQLPDVSLREFLAYGEGHLDGERSEAVREWLAADPRCSHLMLELKGSTRAEEPSAEPSEFEIQKEWRAFEASLDPQEEAWSGERFRWVGVAAAALFVMAAFGWGLHLMPPSTAPTDWGSNILFEELRPGIVRGHEQQQIEVGEGSGAVVLKLLLPSLIKMGRPIPNEVEYEVARQDTIVRQGQLQVQDEGDFILLLPWDFLRPGEYHIRLLATSSADQPSAPIVEYQFNVSDSP